MALLLLLLLSAAPLVAAGPVVAAPAVACHELLRKAGEALEGKRTDDARSLVQTYFQVCPAPAGPDTAHAYGLLGFLDAGARHWPQAIFDLKRAVALAPEEPGLYVVLGDAYYQTGELEKAIDAGQEALALEPASGDEHFSANLLVGDTYRKLAERNVDRHDLRAQPYLENALHLRPEEPAALFAMAQFRQNTDADPAEARALYQKACTHHDTESCIRANRLEPFSTEEQALLGEMRARYLRKGMDPTSTDTLLGNLKTGYLPLKHSDRLQTLRAYVESLK